MSPLLGKNPRSFDRNDSKCILFDFFFFPRLCILPRSFPASPFTDPLSFAPCALPPLLIFLYSRPHFPPILFPYLSQPECFYELQTENLPASTNYEPKTFQLLRTTNRKPPPTLVISHSFKQDAIIIPFINKDIPLPQLIFLRKGHEKDHKITFLHEVH